MVRPTRRMMGDVDSEPAVVLLQPDVHPGVAGDVLIALRQQIPAHITRRYAEYAAASEHHVGVVLTDAAAQRESLARDITTHTLERLAYYKAPGWVAFVDALPLTASNKIQRGELKALAQALPGQAHCVDTRSMKKRQA